MSLLGARTNVYFTLMLARFNANNNGGALLAFFEIGF
jgi:hypothetical protein